MKTPWTRMHPTALSTLLLGVVLASSTPAWAQSGEPGDCPTGLGAAAQEDGSIALGWVVANPTESLNVYRGGGQQYTLVATMPPGSTSYHDTATTVGTTYTYEVRGIGASGEESHSCPFVETLSVPFFPTPLAAGLATVGLLGAFVILRRRK